MFVLKLDHAAIMNGKKFERVSFSLINRVLANEKAGWLVDPASTADLMPNLIRYQRSRESFSLH